MKIINKNFVKECVITLDEKLSFQDNKILDHIQEEYLIKELNIKNIISINYIDINFIDNVNIMKYRIKYIES